MMKEQKVTMSNKHDTVNVTLITCNPEKETGKKRERTIPVLRSKFEDPDWKKNWISGSLSPVWEIKSVA